MSVHPSTVTGRRTDEPNDDAVALTTDQIFHILQNERRRNVLRYLQGVDGPVRMRDVAEQVAAWEHDTTLEELTSEQRQRVYIPLYQSHLPKLDSEGVIDYEQSRGIVYRMDLADQLDPYLDATVSTHHSAAPDEWDGYYVGVTGVGAVLLVGTLVDAPVLSLVSGTALCAIILLLYTIVTVGRFTADEQPIRA